MGPVGVGIMSSVPTELRGQANGISVFFMHLLGDFPSPFAVGLFSELVGYYCAYIVLAGWLFFGSFAWFLAWRAAVGGIQKDGQKSLVDIVTSYRCKETRSRSVVVNAPITSVLELENYLDRHRADLHPDILALYDTVLSGKQTTTHTINLSKTDLSQLPHLAIILRFYPELAELKISESDLAGGKVLFSVIGKMEKLNVLHLQRNCLQAGEGRELSRVLGNLTNLRDLDLSGNNLGTEGVGQIVESIKKLGNLQQLHLQDNNLGSRTIKHLAKELRQLKRLEVAELEGNSFSAEDLRSGSRIHINKD